MHTKYAEFEIPVEIKASIKMGVNPFGSMSKAKMLLFTVENKVDNDLIDQYMKIPTARLENENRAEYKNRLKFQSHLLKFRKFIYKY